MKEKTRMGNSLLPGLKYLAEYFEKGLKQKQSKPQDTFILLQKTKQKKPQLDTSASVILYGKSSSSDELMSSYCKQKCIGKKIILC